MRAFPPIKGSLVGRHDSLRSVECSGSFPLPYHYVQGSSLRWRKIYRGPFGGLDLAPPVELTRLGVKIFLDSVNQLGKSHAGILSFLEFFLAPQLINKGASAKDTFII
jgi:hypothetical protein